MTRSALSGSASSITRLGISAPVTAAAYAGRRHGTVDDARTRGAHAVSLPPPTIAGAAVLTSRSALYALPGAVPAAVRGGNAAPTPRFAALVDDAPGEVPAARIRGVAGRVA